MMKTYHTHRSRMAVLWQWELEKGEAFTEMNCTCWKRGKIYFLGRSLALPELTMLLLGLGVRIVLISVQRHRFVLASVWIQHSENDRIDHD